MDFRRHFPLSKLMSIFSLSIFSTPIELSPLRVAFISVRNNVIMCSVYIALVRLDPPMDTHRWLHTIKLGRIREVLDNSPPHHLPLLPHTYTHTHTHTRIHTHTEFKNFSSSLEFKNLLCLHSAFCVCVLHSVS